MKKVTDFIVEKRNYIIGVFVVLSIISVILMTKVNINYDITSYLPDDSETKIGLDIMNDEFKEESSSFNIMFKDLSYSEKEDIYENLKLIDDVDSVTYKKDNKDYNKDDYTLYKIKVNDKSDSKTAKEVYNNVKEEYKDYNFSTSGEIASRNTKVLEFWIIALAVGICAVILIIMSESYIEPFLFLLTIGIAVLLNKGTNYFFPSVSNITDSICAILQLALSMDYSIMLMNRYRQESEKEKDNIKAMKAALYKAFTAISSSSITTVVGLLALVFMSFKIGADLGIILAKGVVFSLISIFFVLPGLILMNDKLIKKTKKKSLEIKLDKLGNLSYKLRKPALIFAVIIFIVSYFLKGNLAILYTNSENDEVGKVFKEDNQIAVIYKNSDEKFMSDYCSRLDSSEALCYGNTLNKKLKYNEFNKKLDDLDIDTKIDDYILKILYYNYYSTNNDKLTFNEFVSFIQKEVNNNKDIDIDTSKIDTLKNFTDINEINKNKTSKELAEIFDISEDKIDDLLVYYNSTKVNNTMTLSEFVNFMNTDVLTNKNYSSYISKDMSDKLKLLTKLSNKDLINASVSAKEMANIFNMNEKDVNNLYTYYYSVNNKSGKMTIHEFTSFIINNMLNNDEYKNNFDAKTVSNIKLLNTFSDTAITDKKMDSKSLANLFGVEETKVKQILLMYYSNVDYTNKITLKNFIKMTYFDNSNSSYLTNVESLIALNTFTDDEFNNTTLNKEGLAKVFTPELVNTLYTKDMSPKEFVSFALNYSKDNKLVIIDKVINDDTKYDINNIAKILGTDKANVNKIIRLNELLTNNISNWLVTPKEFTSVGLKADPSNSNLVLINKVINTTGALSSKDLSSIIGIDNKTVSNIYSLHEQNKNITPNDFISFIVSHATDKELNGKVTEDIKLVKKVFDATINNTKFNKDELSKMLGSEDIKLVYSLYSSKNINSNITANVKEFTNFVLCDVITNTKFEKEFTNDMVSKLNTINGIINASIDNTKYTPGEIYMILSDLTDELNEDTVDLLYIYYGSNKNYNEKWTMTIEQMINYLNDTVLNDKRFVDFIDEDMKSKIKDGKDKINDAKEMLIGDRYSRIVYNTKLDLESKKTFDFIDKIKKDLKDKEVYVIGDSAMAREMNDTFTKELDFITIITMISIFVVVAITFKSIIAPLILVLIIQCAVYLTMGILSLLGGSVYFIALLIVQSILMGATIDYAILYTSYYIESRKKLDIKESIINSYNKSIHTIFTSASILIIVTLIVGNFATAIAAKICKTLSQGTLCALVLILFVLPPVLAACDKFIIKKVKSK